MAKRKPVKSESGNSRGSVRKIRLDNIRTDDRLKKNLNNLTDKTRKKLLLSQIRDGALDVYKKNLPPQKKSILSKFKKSDIKINPAHGFSPLHHNFKFKKPKEINECQRRRERREVLFAHSIAGRIKVRRANWKAASRVSCKG